MLDLTDYIWIYLLLLNIYKFYTRLYILMLKIEE